MHRIINLLETEETTTNLLIMMLSKCTTSFVAKQVALCLVVYTMLLSITTTSSFIITQQPQHQQTIPRNSYISNNNHGLSKKYSSLTPLQLYKKHTDMTSDHKLSSLSELSNHPFVQSIRSIIITTTFISLGWWCTTTSSSMINVPLVHNSIHDNYIVNAKEMASGSGSRVNKDPESLLRHGLPIQNKEVCIIFVL
jgi:hypothetical protein